MTIDNLKDLEKLIKLCRKTGVSAITVDNVVLQLGQEPFKRSNSPAIDLDAFPEASIAVPKYTGPITEPEAPETEQLTEEQLMFYSAQGHEMSEQQ